MSIRNRFPETGSSSGYKKGKAQKGAPPSYVSGQSIDEGFQKGNRK
jgi:hypothetical protein